MKITMACWWRDRLFFAALAAGALFWLAFFIISEPKLNLAWPLHNPLRFLYLALLYPVVEELVFRGLIQDAVHRHLPAWRIGPLSHANILTSLLFTGLHFFAHPALWAAAVFAPSLLFGFFKDRSGGLGAPIALHVLYNAGYFWIFAP